MSKEPATPPHEGGEPSSRSRGANAAPFPPGTRRSRYAGVQGERQAVQGALHDGAGTSSAMAAQGGNERHVSLVLPPPDGGQVVHPGQPQERPYRGDERPPPPGHGGGGVTQQPAQAGRPRPPTYVPRSQAARLREQPRHAAPPPSLQPLEEERPMYPLGAPPIGGAPSRRKLAFGFKKKKPEPPVAHDARPQPDQHAPGEASAPPGVGDLAAPPGVGGLATPAGAAPLGGGSLATPAGAAPPYGGGSATAPGRAPSRGRFGFGLSNTKSIQRVPTMVDFAPETGGGPPPSRGRFGFSNTKSIRRVPTMEDFKPENGGSQPPSRGRPGVSNTKRVPTMVDFAPETGGSQPPQQEHDANPRLRPQTEKYPVQEEHGAYPHPPPGLRKEKYPVPPPRKHDAYPPHPPPPKEKYPPPPHGHEAYSDPEYPPATPTGPLSERRKERTTGRASPMFLQQRKKKRRPVAIFFTLCCILFWLLVVALGVAVLLMYLMYHPQSPRLRVTTATLNAGYVDQLPPPHTGLALNSDLSVLATIYNPNTKIDVVLRYMQLDLYFGGVMIGTQAVWPPILARPGESPIRDVHLVVSEVRLSPENAEAWRNATAKGGLVEVKLAARFHVQLNFGHWFPFRYWVHPSCSLWLDPPPGGALRRARCHKSTI